MRDQKLAHEISAAKRERDFYMSRVDKAKGIAAQQERKRKVRACSIVWGHHLISVCCTGPGSQAPAIAGGWRTCIHHASCSSTWCHMAMLEQITALGPCRSPHCCS